MSVTHDISQISAAGWYPGPDGINHYWDGHEWVGGDYPSTTQVGPVPNPTVPPPPYGPAYQVDGDAPMATNAFTPMNYPAQYAAANTKMPKGFSIASWITGIVGLLVFGIILGPLAITFGFISNSKRQELGGKKQWGSIVLGVITTVLSILAVALTLAGVIPPLF